MKTTPTFLSLLFIQLFCNAYCFGLDIKTEIEKLQQRTLIVIIEEVQKSTLSKLNSAEKTPYEKAIGSYNRKNKEVIEKHWKLNTKIEYKTWAEAKAIPLKSQDAYLILFACRQSTNIKYSDFLDYGLHYYNKIYIDNEKRNYVDFITMYKLSKLESWKTNAVVTRTIMNIWPLKEDILFSVQYIQCLLNESKRLNVQADNILIMKENYQLLKNSTLLLNYFMLQKKEITSEQIKGVYPFNYKIATPDSLLQSIFNNQDIVYIEITPQLISTGEAYRLGYEHVLMHAKTGMLVRYVDISTGVLHATAGLGYHHKYITLGIFKDYIKMDATTDFIEPE